MLGGLVVVDGEVVGITASLLFKRTNESENDVAVNTPAKTTNAIKDFAHRYLSVLFACFIFEINLVL